LNAYGYSIVLTYLAIENALQRGHDQLALSHFSAIYIAKTGFTADGNPFKADAGTKSTARRYLRNRKSCRWSPDLSQTEGQKVTAIVLGLTLPLMEGEPTTYFASRLAARNFLKARPFARGRYGLYVLGSRLRDRDLAVIRDQWSVGCGARGKRLP
jgi:hypothetical protein